MKKQRSRFKRSVGPIKQQQRPPAPVALAPVSGGKSRFANPLLNQVEAGVEGALTSKNRDAYQRVVVAAMRVALKDGPTGIMASIKDSADPVSDAAKGAVNLAVMLLKEFRYTIPPEALVPAAHTVMLEALDFAERIGKLRINEKVVDDATHIFTNQIMAAFHITPDKLKMLATKTNGIMRDPTQMEMIARRTGVVRAPGASTPTFTLSEGET